MKRFLFLLVVYTVLKQCKPQSLVKPGEADITCASCPIGNTTCSETCAATSCIAIQEFNTFQNANGTYRSCPVTNNTCNPLSFTLTSAVGRQVMSSTACCKTEKCNEHLSLGEPSTSSDENGVHCPACEGLNKACTSNPKIACRGAEYKCISLAGKFHGDVNQTLEIKGCATESACRLVKGDLMAYGSNVYELTLDATCTNGASFVTVLSSVILLLPAVVPFMASILS